LEKISSVVYRVSLLEQPDYTDLVHASYMRKWKTRDEVSTSSPDTTDKQEEPAQWRTFGGSADQSDLPAITDDPRPMDQEEEEEEEFLDPSYEPEAGMNVAQPERQEPLLDRVKNVFSDAAKAVRRTIAPFEPSSSEDEAKSVLPDPVIDRPDAGDSKKRRPRRREHELLDPVPDLQSVRQPRAAKQVAIQNLKQFAPKSRKKP
jgi:hypothetical protein